MQLSNIFSLALSSCTVVLAANTVTITKTVTVTGKAPTAVKTVTAPIPSDYVEFTVYQSCASSISFRTPLCCRIVNSQGGISLYTGDECMIESTDSEILLERKVADSFDCLAIGIEPFNPPNPVFANKQACDASYTGLCCTTPVRALSFWMKFAPRADKILKRLLMVLPKTA